MEYNFKTIEQDWQKYWADNKTFKAEEKSNKPKYYVLDMFPYPSGAGLHVGHPLGYIASDIYARYKRLKGFNVLHPMGYDSFGLPAEQYAIQTGQHPAITTQQNIARYREQLDKIGFSFDWDREVRTSNPDYYKWTQWIFIQLFNSWYNPETDKAEKIGTLIDKFKQKVLPFGEDLGGADWDKLSEKEQQDILMNYRLTYLSEAWVNWCPALGTVLANDEVKDGVSERGGHPVERKLMKQWSMRITAYAQRLLDGLETIDWTESIKEAQRNWIGRSVGTSLKFKVAPSNSPEGGELPSANPSLLGRTGGASIEVFTTRPDTIFGVSFVTLAPEHELVNELTTTEYKQAVDEYVLYAKNRSERERQADVKKITGQFTGSYVLHPFTNEPIPVWIGDYVLAGYGTGAVMAVPAHDTRDYAFAKYFNLPIKEVVAGGDLEKEAYDAKEGKLVNSDFLNGLEVKEAIKKAIAVIEEKKLGKGKTNYRLRDAVFGRQRYWGEPIPVYFENGIAKVLPEDKLPLVLPEVDKYLPTEDGEPPLARAKNWSYEPLSNSPQKGEDGGSAKWQTAANSSWGELKERSRDLRNNQTEAELALWNHLNTKQLNYKFRRQHVIGTNIVDFVCLSKKLIIEVDGKIHLQQKEYDQARTNELESLGFKVIRFENERILSNIDDVLNEITTELKVLPTGEDLGGAPYETTTMPGWAGSSWYFYRYMDSQNKTEFASQQSINYWQDVDLYIGGSEHATGHLLYSRFWNKFLFDLGLVPKEEPFKKLINQGMIQGTSEKIYRAKFVTTSYSDNHKSITQFKIDNETIDKILGDLISKFPESIPKEVDDFGKQVIVYISADLVLNKEEFSAINVDINLCNNSNLNISGFNQWRKGEDYKILVSNDCVWVNDLAFSLVPDIESKFKSFQEPEKMSKSKYNVVSPDDICEKFGADTLRLYEMFLGPLELSKPWNTNGITGVHGFLKKLWRLFYASGEFVVSNDEPTKTELKTLHKTIKKIVEDIERFSFNTSVSNFMICVNELTDAKCNKRAILEPLLITLAPYAPHIAEELWKQLGNKESITFATFPEYNESYLVDDTINYPVSFNGKTRFMLELAATMNAKEIEEHVMALADTQKYLEGKTPKKVIIVPKKIVNIVV